MLEILTFIFLARVAIYDIKTYLIRNLDIFLLLIFLIPKIAKAWEFGLINLIIYLIVGTLLITLVKTIWQDLTKYK